MAEHSDVPEVLKGAVCHLSANSCVVVLNAAPDEERISSLLKDLQALLPELAVTVITSISQLTVVHAT